MTAANGHGERIAALAMIERRTDRPTDVTLVAETGKSLERIVAQVTEINKVVREIAVSAQEQATGLEQINTAMNQMDHVTQKNAAMVEEATAATHTLAQETSQLSDLIGRFQLGQTERDDSMRRELQNAAPHAFRQPPKDVPAETAKAATRLMRAAPKARVANGAPVGVAMDDWKEF